jgi:hypothetical protein
MPLNPPRSLREALDSPGDSSKRFLWGAAAGVSLNDLGRHTGLGGHLPELSAKSVLIATRDQLSTALALVELDGVAARIILCPPDIPLAQFPAVIEKGCVDAVVSDYELHDHVCPPGMPRLFCSAAVTPASDAENLEYRPTEWVLLTSGTTGAPKMIAHNLESLAAPIFANGTHSSGAVWGTFYDIRRYGGLQIFLRAVLGDGSIVLSSAGEPRTE